MKGSGAGPSKPPEPKKKTLAELQDEADKIAMDASVFATKAASQSLTAAKARRAREEEARRTTKRGGKHRRKKTHRRRR